MWCMQRRARQWCWLIGMVGLLAITALPATACGCGAYLPREGDAHVAQERALIRWENGTEDIVMALSIEGQSQEAAWILPVPSRATVQLADPRLFDTLQELTKPLVRVKQVWSVSSIPSGATGGAAVTLLDRQALGPFDVSTLAANDAQALDQWLSTNGYPFPPRLAETLEPYVAQGWEYVAVRLTPATADHALTGNLDPLWVSFDSDEMIYPMRPTALAHHPVPVYLYVLAEHRVDLVPPLVPGTEGVPGGASVPYAQWLDPAALAPDSPLAPFVQRTRFLTKFDLFFYVPTSITDDVRFRFASADATYHQVDVQYEVVPVPWGRWGRWALVVAAALVGMFGVRGIWRRARR